MGSAGLLVLGTLGAALALKGCDQVLRYSIDKSTTELLYLPLSARIKLQVKWFIRYRDLAPGDGLAGLVVLIFATSLHLPARQISWIALLLVGGWLVASLRCAAPICRYAEGEYRPTSGRRGANFHSGLGPFDRGRAGNQPFGIRPKGHPLTR